MSLLSSGGDVSKEKGERSEEVSYPFSGGRSPGPGELHYHSRPGPPPPGGAGEEHKVKRIGIFKKNPSLMLILIDIIVVVLVLIFLLPILRPKTSVNDFFGYSFSLHGFLHENQANVSMVIQPEGPGPEAASASISDGSFVLSFRILDTDISEDVIVREARISDGPLVLRKKFVIPEKIYENEVYIRCTVTRTGDSVRLQKKLVE